MTPGLGHECIGGSRSKQFITSYHKDEHFLAEKSEYYNTWDRGEKKKYEMVLPTQIQCRVPAP